MSRGLGKKQRYLLARLREEPVITIPDATEAYLAAMHGSRYYFMSDLKKRKCQRTCRASLRRAARELERRGLCTIVRVWHLVPVTKVTTESEINSFGWNHETWSYNEKLVRRRRIIGYRSCRVAGIAR